MARQTLLLIRHAEKPEDGEPGGVAADGAPDKRSLTPKGWQAVAVGRSYLRRLFGATSSHPDLGRSSLQRRRVVMAISLTMAAAKAVGRAAREVENVPPARTTRKPLVRATVHFRRAPIAVLMLGLGAYPLSAADLFQPPPHGGTPDISSPAAVDSSLTLSAVIPYSEIAHAGDLKIPPHLPLAGNGDIACLNIPRLVGGHAGHHTECKKVLGARICVEVPDFTSPHLDNGKQCANYHWNADVAKNGPLSVGQAGGAVHVEQSLHITGQAGVEGDLAHLLSLSGKTIDVQASPAVNLNADMNSNWCPIIQAPPTGRWVNSASVEIAGKNCVSINLGPFGHPSFCAGPINLGLADVLNGEIDKHRDQIQKTASDAISCDQLRAKIAAQWHPLSIKVEAANRDALFVNIVPTGAGFSGLIAEASGVRLIVRMSAKTSVDPTAAPETAIPLPPLGRATADRGNLDIHLPVTATYSFVIDELAKQLKGRDFTQHTAVGTIAVHIDDVDLYPSGSSIVLGLKIDAKLPGAVLNTSGWVYISGHPVVEASGRAISIQQLQFATVLDSAFWRVTQSLFEGEILAELNSHAHIDLSGQIDDVAARVSTAVANANLPSLILKADKPTITLTGAGVGPNALVATADLSMKFDAELTSALIEH
jgi:hypothetical protein